ncbi:MAG: ATP-binding protein [Bacteroidota bacterium]
MPARLHDPHQRADALRRFFVPDAPQEQPLERVVRLAAMLFAVERVALVTIERGDRRLVATQGLGDPAATASHPEMAALRRALVQPIAGEKIPLFTADAYQDERFAGHALRGHPSVRFYASAPLKSAEGYTIGVLKLFDAVPRELSDDGLTLLTDLAAMAESERSAQRQVAAAEARAQRNARHDAFARAVGTTAERFLRADDWQNEAAQALQHLAEAAGAQAVQVYSNHRNEGRLVAEQSFAWSSEESTVPARLDYAADGLQRWADVLDAGRCLCASYSTLAEPERAFLDAKQARGVAVAPLVIDGAWAGFLCFDFAREALALDPAEEEALRAAAEAFGAVLERDRRRRASARTTLHDAAPLPLFVCVDGVVALANPAAQRLVGPSVPLVGHPFHNLVPAEMQDEVAAFLNAHAPATEAGAPDARAETPLRVRLVAADRQIRVVDLEAAQTTFQSQSGVLVCMHDVTEHAEQLRSARAAQAAAEGRAGLVSNLMTGLNQEVRTPLTSILGYAELLAGSLQGADLDQLGVIRKSGQQLSRTIEAVYELARLGGRSSALAAEPLPLLPLLADAERTYAPLAQERGLRFLLKPPPEHTLVHADPRALTRVLGQLLTNAIQFTEAGYVEVRARMLDAHVLIEIEDTGCGMGASFLTTARAPFRREHTGSTRSALPGAGLGLTLADLLLERMQGQLDIQSQQGQGTLCRVTLPAPAGPDYRPAHRVAAADGASVEPPVPRITLPSLAPPVASN